jgi:hypothetical protein
VVALSERPGDGRFDDERKLSGHRRIVLRISLRGMIRAIERLLPFINTETAVVPGQRSRHSLIDASRSAFTREGLNALSVVPSGQS